MAIKDILLFLDDGKTNAQRIQAAICLANRFYCTVVVQFFIPYIDANKVPPQKAIVAWDGTPAVSRSLHNAIPLLKKLTQIYILVSENDNASTGTYARLTEY